ncbi:DUF1654 domain-containing protein [Pseudomonas syringae]|uniref:DUF1654 domain-containing protein n=1 Tax=Pseudomonas syringae TaxID=317 RepID=A0A9Q4A9J1_PSESX|nr:DUF1654 domain-containing protein [Pseudomonas syringae]MCF5472220.1 DUF1654 domain-containing protein [Pseudomonas syringae]MCF5481802.1 DUF1654 domain-containing protein [Pseudomonas syringae]MCF5486852.1 DUF1654 domain-containing protein [Pseudomonas syringae]MCF5493386.1 DUF1654 domain-containing protein [Pseudomonas syringae]
MLQEVPIGVARQPSTPFQRLLRRIYRQINSPASQNTRHTTIAKQPDESASDWDVFLEQLELEESVRVTRVERGVARLKWTNQHPS